MADLLTITSNRAKWIKKANDTASVFRRTDVQAEVRRGLVRGIHQMNKRQIEGRGIGKSGRFAPLKPITIARKGHDRPLIDSGKLFRQATRGGSIKAGYVEAFKTYLFSFNISHRAINFLQKGTKHMPARPPIDPNERQTEALSDAIWASLKKGFKRIGWADRVRRAGMTGFDRIDVG